MLVHLRRSLVMCVFCLVFFGFVYAFAGTGVAQVLFPIPGRRLRDEERFTLIGQNWSSPKWFHGRPDDTGPYAASATQRAATTHWSRTASTASRPRPTWDRTRRRSRTTPKHSSRYWHKLGVKPTIDLVTTSGSGYDPDISALDATVQIPMITKARVSRRRNCETLIKQQTHPAQWGFMGSSYIDVLQLNEGLAKLEK